MSPRFKSHITFAIIVLILAYPSSIFWSRIRNVPYLYVSRMTSNLCLDVECSEITIARRIQRTLFDSNDTLQSSIYFANDNDKRSSRDGNESGEDSKEKEETQQESDTTPSQEQPRSRIPTYDEFARFKDSSRPPDSHYPMGPSPNYRGSFDHIRVRSYADKRSRNGHNRQGGEDEDKSLEQEADETEETKDQRSTNSTHYQHNPSSSFSRRKKTPVKSRIPTYDEFARFKDSSRPPDSHYTNTQTPSAEPSPPSSQPTEQTTKTTSEESPSFPPVETPSHPSEETPSRPSEENK